jgi:hypothetical protein
LKRSGGWGVGGIPASLIVFNEYYVLVLFHDIGVRILFWKNDFVPDGRMVVSCERAGLER